MSTGYIGCVPFSWSELENFPFKMGPVITVVYNNKIHIIGNNYEHLDPDFQYGVFKHYVWDGKNEITYEEPIDLSSYGLVSDFNGNGVVYQNKIHMFIMNSSYSANIHLTWDPDNGYEFIEETPFVTMNIGPSMNPFVVYDGCIHLIGNPMDPSSKQHYSYDGNSWFSYSNDLPTGDDCYIPPVVYDGKIFLMEYKWFFDELAEKDRFKIYYFESAIGWREMIVDGTKWPDGQDAVPNDPYAILTYKNKIHIIGSNVQYSIQSQHFSVNENFELSIEPGEQPYVERYPLYAVLVFKNLIYFFGGRDIEQHHQLEDHSVKRYFGKSTNLINIIKRGFINTRTNNVNEFRLIGIIVPYLVSFSGNDFLEGELYYEREPDGNSLIITNDETPQPGKTYYTIPILKKYSLYSHYDEEHHRFDNDKYIWVNTSRITTWIPYYVYELKPKYEIKSISKVYIGDQNGTAKLLLDASYWLKFINYPDLQEKKILFKVECGENLFIGLADGTLYVYDGETVTNLGVQENAPISTNYIGDAMGIDDTTFVFCNCEQEIVGKIKGYIYIYYGTYENGIFNWTKKKVKALDNNFLQYSDVNLVFTASYFFKINNIPFIYLQNWRRNETSTTRPKSAIVDHSYSDFDGCGIYKLDLTSMDSGEYYIFTDGSSYGGRGAGQISDSRLINRTFDSNVGTAWYTDIVSQCISSKPAVIGDDIYVLGYYTSFGMKYTASPKKYEILDKKVTFTLKKFHYDGQKSMPLVQETDLSGMGINIEPQSTTVFNVIVAHDSQLYLFDWTNNYWYLIDLSEETPKLIMQKNNGVMGLPFNVLAEKMPDTYNLNYYPYYDHFKYLSTYEQNGKTPIVYEDHILLFPEDESIKIYKSNPEGYFS